MAGYVRYFPSLLLTQSALLYFCLDEKVDSVLYLSCLQSDQTTKQKIIVFILLSISKM